MTVTSEANTPENPLGLYLLNLVVGNVGTPGAPILHLGLLVDAPTGRVTGHGAINQSVPPPDGTITLDDLSGWIRNHGVNPPVATLVLNGTYLYFFPAPAIGVATVPFTATLVVPTGTQVGRGTFTYWQHTVTDVPVTVTQSP